MGDKTQLLAFVLATKFKNKKAVLSGILVATILNHSVAAIFGKWVSGYFEPRVLNWILALSFFAFSIWILIPDKEEGIKEGNKWGAFWTTTVLFFFAEMGDKTQLSTVALAASYSNVVNVTIGTTLGMMISDGLAVFFGEKITQIISMKLIRIFSATLFVGFGIYILAR